MKDTHSYGKKMARNGRTKVIYKGRFICIQTLCPVFLLIKNSINSKNAAAYAAEQLLLQETFLKHKIRGFNSRAAYDGARTID